jgi:hypothetical protein
MIRRRALARAALGLIVGAAATASFRGAVADTDCAVELLSESTSPDGTRVVQYRRGICDGGTTVLHTLEIARADQPPTERVPGAMLRRVQNADPSSHREILPLRFQWVDNKWLEVAHPPTVQFSGSLVLNGVRVTGEPMR